jgi:hypothetical protein
VSGDYRLANAGVVLSTLLAVWAMAAEHEANQQRIASDKAKQEAVEARDDADDSNGLKDVGQSLGCSWTAHSGPPDRAGRLGGGSCP